MSSLQDIQDLMTQKENQMDEELTSLRSSLEKLQETQTRSVRSLGQIRRAVHTKIERIQQLYNELQKQNDTLNKQLKIMEDKIQGIIDDIIGKIKTYDSPESKVKVKPKLFFYKMYLPSLLLILKELLEPPKKK